MMYANPLFVELLIERVVAERLHRAEIERLVRQTQAERPGWLFRSSCRLLSRSGHLLVALGRRLERHASAQPVVLEPAEAQGRE